jgi:hypothetical protein
MIKYTYYALVFLMLSIVITSCANKGPWIVTGKSTPSDFSDRKYKYILTCVNNGAITYNSNTDLQVGDTVDFISISAKTASTDNDLGTAIHTYEQGDTLSDKYYRETNHEKK